MTQTALDLDAIIAAGWADPVTFPLAEYERAVAAYMIQVGKSQRLLCRWRKARNQVERWTGYAPWALGSLRLRLGIGTSDLDLAVGCPTDRWLELSMQLEAHTEPRGEHATWFGTTRRVFSFTLGAVEVDLSVMAEDDLVATCRMLDRIDHDMTEPERIAHWWVKWLLWQQERYEEYAAWKLVVYRRFCPEYRPHLELAGP